MSDLDDLDRQWHDWRQGGVGGSDIAALIGLSRYASPTSLYYSKIGLIEPTEETPRQRIGKRMEAVLAAEFADRTGLTVIGEQTWCEHPEHPWARCTVDGFVTDIPFAADAVLGVVEFKTDGRFGWPDGVPANIRAQTIWQMGVTGKEHAWVVVMFAGFRVEVFEIPWDVDARSDWEFMLDAAATFWEQVETRNPPAPDGHEATTAALTEIFVDPDGWLDAVDTSRALVAELQAAKRRTAAAEAEEDRLGNELRALLGECTDLVDGWTVPRRGDPKPVVLASWRPQQSRRVDLTALREAEPELAEKFTTITTTRVLRVARAKEES